MKATLEDLKFQEAKAVATPGVNDRHEKLAQELERYKGEQRGCKEDRLIEKGRRQSKVEERRYELRSKVGEAE